MYQVERTKTMTATVPESFPTGPEPAQRLLDLDMVRDARSAGNPLTLCQLRALLSLSDLGMQSAQGLADQMQVERSVIDGLCPPLVRRGFLIRIPHGSSDGSSAIVLSTAGRRFVGHMKYRNSDTFRGAERTDPHDRHSEWSDDEDLRSS
jgi:DNA-binding MarR family transcriptional regulator